MIRMHIISLAGSHARRLRMQQQLNDLQIAYEFFDAVDGRALSERELADVAPKNGRDYGGMLTPAEIGCALSHLSLIKKMAQSEHDYFCVLEDDVLITADLRKFLDVEFLSSLPPFDILQLNRPTRNPRLTLDLGCFDGFRIFMSPRSRFNMSAIIWTRSAARTFASRITEISAPIDNMIFHDRRPFGFRVLEVRPAIVTADRRLVSDIGHRPRPSNVLTKLAREVRRTRNWGYQWLSFIHVYGFSEVLRLRPLQTLIDFDPTSGLL